MLRESQKQLNETEDVAIGIQEDLHVQRGKIKKIHSNVKILFVFVFFFVFFLHNKKIAFLRKFIFCNARDVKQNNQKKAKHENIYAYIHIH